MSNIMKVDPNIPDRRHEYTTQTYQKSDLLTDTSMLNEEEKQKIVFAMNKEWTNPKYKLKYFVGNAQITPFAKYRQWLLELKSKEESIENVEYEVAKYEVEIKRFQRMADQAHDDLDRELAMIECKNAEKNMITTKRRLNDWYLERAHLLDLLKEFEESEEAKLPDGSGRTYQDILNTAEEDVYEAEYWTNRLAKQAATDMIFYGRIGAGNMDAILQMDPEQQAETLALTVNFSTKLQHYTLRLQDKAEQQLKLGQDQVDTRALETPEDDNKLLDTNSGEDMLKDVYNL